MPATPTRRFVCALVGAGAMVLTMACSGSAGSGSFASNQREAIPTNVIGKSDTSGIGAGASLAAPGTGSGASPTSTVTTTPLPSK
jgi:hypothetical protein